MQFPLLSDTHAIKSALYQSRLPPMLALTSSAAGSSPTLNTFNFDHVR